MENIIYKTTPIKDAKEMLNAHGIPTGYGWDLIVGMILKGCDYISVHGFGKDAYFTLGGKDETIEETDQISENQA